MTLFLFVLSVLMSFVLGVFGGYHVFAGGTKQLIDENMALRMLVFRAKEPANEVKSFLSET